MTRKEKQTWNDLFNEFRQQGRAEASSMNEKYISLGEIDYPEEMLSNINVKWSDVQGVGKTNWLKSVTTGKYFHVNDSTLDSLYDMGKIISDDFDYNYEDESSDPEYQKYCALSKEEQIEYRVKNQGISKQLAKDLVYYEFGYSYNYSVEYKVTEVICNTFDGSKEEEVCTMTIEADNVQEANEMLTSQIRKEGQTVRTFVKYPENYKPTIGEIITGGNFPRFKKYVVSVNVELLQVNKNN